jgi:DNA-binding transcriptional regulator YiaG
MDTDNACRISRLRRMLANGEAARIRQRARITRAEAAATVGVATSTLCRWELGRRNPSACAALAYLTLLEKLR